MEIILSDSFFESLKKIKRNNTFYMKIINFFRYDLFRFFFNIYRFRNLLYKYKSFNYEYSLLALKISLSNLLTYIEKGNELEEIKNKKCQKIQRVILLIEDFCKDNFIKKAELKLGKKLNQKYLFSKKKKDLNEKVINQNSEIFKLAMEMEEAQWKEIWDIIKGRQAINFKDFDGSDMRTW